MNRDILRIDAAAILEYTPMPKLIAAIRQAFQSTYESPVRAAHRISDEASLLLMPSWRTDGLLGVKITSVDAARRPSVKATYLLMQERGGQPVAIMDGSMLTARRTAATSALASSLLSRVGAATLLIAGTGALAPHLIEAHCAVRKITSVLIWGRDRDKALALALQAREQGFPAVPIDDLREGVAASDIVSAATLSKVPLITESMLHPGLHIDLVGAFKCDMAEADPGTFRNARVFVDSKDGALEEAGDLLQAIDAGALHATQIEAELAELCRETHPGRAGDDQAITLFKSVGMSLEDLAAACLVMDGVRAAALTVPPSAG